MGDQTKKQRRISADIAKEQARMKENRASNAASTSAPAKPGTPSSYAVKNAANTNLPKRKMGNVKSASGIGGSSKSKPTTKAGSGLKRMFAAKNANYGCGAK